MLYTRRTNAALAAVILLLIVLFALPLVSLAGPPLNATMLLGRDDLGSGCLPPTCFDDGSYHAVDKFQPGAVTISEGGTVDFDVEGFHQVAIYAPGISANDIVVDPSAFPFVGDPNGLLYMGGVGSDESYTFDEPGKYLIICNVAPHLEFAQMWGWVNVK